MTDTAAKDEGWWLERLKAYEDGPFTTNFDQLVRAGVPLPEPDTLDDVALGRTLWTVILALADRRVFIEHTDHLCDRDLYAHLWHRSLRDEVPDIDADADSTCHLDLLGGWSEEDTQVFLQYYADDEWRKDWLVRFPNLHMPSHASPPFDRDRHLPRP